MVSWAGTLATAICMLTLVSREVNGLIQVRPGWRTPGRACPKRNTTPCSYWRMILKPNISAIPSLAQVCRVTGPADGAGVTASVRNARGPAFIITHHGARTGRPSLRPRGPGTRGRAARSGDPAPAELGGLPAGDGLVLADDLDLPQMQARVVHGLLGPRHPVTGRRLRDLVLGSGLLDENQVRRAGVPGHIRMNTHTLYDAAPFPAVPAAAMACGTRRA